MRHSNQYVPTELTRLQEFIEGKEIKKAMKEKLDTKLEEAHERLDEIEAKSGGSGDPEGEIAEIIVLEQRMEGFQTVIMTQLHKEPANAFVNQEELMTSLVPMLTS
jgi:predicted nuclease with TOPRIM domain